MFTALPILILSFTILTLGFTLIISCIIVIIVVVAVVAAIIDVIVIIIVCNYYYTGLFGEFVGDSSSSLFKAEDICAEII